MSKLLLDEKPLMVMPKLAVKIGLNEAIVLQQIHYWIEINKQAKINFIDGRTWTFNSVREWKEQFPFWSEKTINRTLKKLAELNLLLTGNYNKKGYDRTLWYTINYDQLTILEQQEVSSYCENSLGQNDQMITTDCPNGVVILGKPIPETTKEITKDTTKKEKKGVREGISLQEDTTSISLPFYDYVAKLLKNYNTTYKHEILETIIYYFSKYKETFGEDHIRYTKELCLTVISKLDDLYSIGIYDENNDRYLPLEFEYIKDIVDSHFNTKYKECSYTLLSFINDNILKNRFYEIAY